MKKQLTALGIAAALTLCAGAQPASAANEAAAEQSQEVQLPTPFTQYTSLEEARRAAGFDFPEPDYIPEGYSENALLVWNDGSIAQLSYRNDDEQRLDLRISKKLSAQQMNGDYNKYADKNVIYAAGRGITCLGDDGKVSVAMWRDSDYNYCLMSDEPLEVNELRLFVRNINKQSNEGKYFNEQPQSSF